MNWNLLSLKLTIAGAALMVTGAAAWYPGTDGSFENILFYSGFILLLIGLLTGNKKCEDTKNDTN